MKRIVPIVLAAALFMEHMDSTVIATSLPAIAADIGSSPIALKLALTSYYIALAVFIPISGRIADRWGPKLVFQWAIVVFVAGSLACAFANSLDGFVAARFLQGMGGAMMTPVGRLLLVRSVPKSDLVSAMAWFTIPALIGPLVGPAIGGAITTFADWRYIFFINLPIGIAGILLARRFLPSIEAMRGVQFDLPGFALSGLACAGLVFGASVISLPALPPSGGVGLTAAGALGAVFYVRHARRTAHPVLDLRLNRIPTFRAALSGGALFRMGGGALPFLLPLMLQLGFGYTPFESGLVTCASVGGAIVMKFLAGPILKRTGFKATLIATALLAGPMTAAISLFSDSVPIAALVTLLLVSGFFRSLFFTSVNSLAFADVPVTSTGDATAMMSAVQQIAIAMGVAMAGAALEISMILGGRNEAALPDFALAFVVVGGVVAAAALTFIRLPPDAGAELSGRRSAAE